jgi:type II secretory pathway pseudopilin PulG
MRRNRSPVARLAGQSGLTLVETLIATVLLFVIAIGILPLFARAMAMNSKGNSTTIATNAARSTLERYLQLDFNAPELTLSNDASTRLETWEYFDEGDRDSTGDERWVAVGGEGAIPGDPSVSYSRQVAVQQFASGDLLDDGLLDTPLRGDAPADDVQLKRIQVTVRGRRATGPALGPVPAITLQTVKGI